MKENSSLSGLIMLVSLLGASLAHANDDPQDSIAVIEVNAANQFVTRHENAVIIDVRTPVEYEMSHLTGSRSSRALKTLKNLGFKHLYSLEGGYVAWKDAELPLTEPSN